MNYRSDKKYRIDPLRQSELFYSCKQYPRWIAELDAMADLKAVNNDGQPHGTKISDPTGSAVVRREKLKKKVSLIEKTAKDAGGDIWKGLLLGVTQGMSFEQLKECRVLFCERDMYYQKRRIFFWMLDRRTFYDDDSY